VTNLLIKQGSCKRLHTQALEKPCKEEVSEREREKTLDGTLSRFQISSPDPSNPSPGIEIPKMTTWSALTLFTLVDSCNESESEA
jgi:hypothetical protein